MIAQRQPRPLGTETSNPFHMRRSLITTSPYASLAAFAFAVPLSFGLIQSAQQAAADEPGLRLPLLELGIGAAGYHNPSYPGSDVRTTTDFPFPYLISRGWTGYASIAACNASSTQRAG